mgnify:CR=1 FL=1
MAEPSDLQHDDSGAADGLDRDIDGGLEGFVDALVSHQRDVYAFIGTLLPQAADIEDVYQQTCLALWKKRHQYDPRRAFFPWACGFAKNEALKQIRRSSRQVQLTAGMLELLAGAALADPRAEDRRVALDACLDKLPRPQRELLRTCYEGSRPIKAIASSMTISAAALTMRLQRIRQTVVRCVEKTLAAWEGS